jgi:colanic acid biosynthesis glycosyl transferase WcaI
LRILLITLYYPPEITSNGVLMERLVRDLRERDHRITVIAAFPQYAALAGVAKSGWWPFLKRSREDGTTVWRIRVPAFGSRESFVSRTITYLLFNVASVFTALLCGPQDMVFTLSPPLTNGIVSSLVGRLKRAHSVYNVQDLVPEAYVQFGVLKSRSVIWFFEMLENFVYRHNALTVISDSFRDHVVRRKISAEKITVIPNFVDTDEIRPLPRENELSERLGLAGKFVVMHAGSIAYRHGVEVLVDAASLLRDLPDVLFMVVGDGAKRHAVEERAQQAGLPNFRMCGYFDRADLALLRACADVQMIVLRRGHTSHSVPSKVYEIMASGRPFVAAVDEGSTIWDIARKASCGLTAAPESPEEIAAAVRRLHGDRQLACQMGANGRAHALAHFSAEAVGRQYDELFRRLKATNQDG